MVRVAVVGFSGISTSLIAALKNAQMDVVLADVAKPIGNDLILKRSQEPFDDTFALTGGKQKAQWKQETYRRPRG